MDPPLREGDLTGLETKINSVGVQLKWRIKGGSPSLWPDGLGPLISAPDTDPEEPPFIINQALKSTLNYRRAYSWKEDGNTGGALGIRTQILASVRPIKLAAHRFRSHSHCIPDTRCRCVYSSWMQLP